MPLRSLQIFFFILLTSFACSQTKEVKKDIPTDGDGKYDLYYNYINGFKKQLSLKQLEKGADSMTIRIWYEYSLWKYKEMYELTKSDQKWIMTHYAFWTEVKEPDYERIITKKIRENVNSKMSGDSLIYNLIRLGIDTLPDMYKIPGLFDGWTDGISYCFEIATKNKYRFYTYHLPEKFTKFKQAKQCVDILNLLDNEFDIKNRWQEIIRSWR